ncbi:hypothetical protein JI721_12895 [Alicyclobacillus cycloheptanicus]|uniref:Uncharacterized protein n=1 Tax=Alicyclobacillus cycloheptanicus TaxID=1457 RepID=A0ABT9XEL9_9BACL|nr:hypothetical protein [Alicyclobacillus cycloheptanicus]MDQ0188744.1 hypothetical protein [Alicyclobacillus cycloheptanicus]WDM00596.1 hypothetical protein JI721_12895 [Alicyclobacillus cycloheptanicus]
MRMCHRQERTSWNLKLTLAAAGFVLGSLSIAGHAHVALADTPAVTDFGQEIAQAAMVSGEGAPQALFVTRYADGHEHMEVHAVRGDSVVAFAGEHPGWYLDRAMTYLLHMPVYVRAVPSPAADSGHTAV